MCRLPTRSPRLWPPTWRSIRFAKPPSSYPITCSRPALPTCQFVRFLWCYARPRRLLNWSTLVTSFPDDPQPRLGLNKCMEALRNMDVIWPSAGRAWELLNGNKVNLPGLSPKSYPEYPVERQQQRKRPAETQLQDSSPSTSGGSQAPGFNQVFTNGVSELGAYPSLADSNNSSQYYDYGRWLGSADLLGNNATGGLSTSLLPQQYSTGFTSGAGRGGQAHRHRGNGTSTRYAPPLWTDPSMGQLDPAYVGMLPQQPSQEQHSTAGSQGLVNLVNQSHQDQSLYQLTGNYLY